MFRFYVMEESDGTVAVISKPEVAFGYSSIFADGRSVIDASDKAETFICPFGFDWTYTFFAARHTDQGCLNPLVLTPQTTQFEYINETDLTTPLAFCTDGQGPQYRELINPGMALFGALFGPSSVLTHVFTAGDSDVSQPSFLIITDSDGDGNPGPANDTAFGFSSPPIAGRSVNFTFGMALSYNPPGCPVDTFQISVTVTS